VNEGTPLEVRMTDVMSEESEIAVIDAVLMNENEKQPNGE